MSNIIDKYLEFLYTCFMYDMIVFSQPWMYYWLLIPAFFYFFFFLMKWYVLTLPVWFPIRSILSVFAPRKKPKKKKKEEQTEINKES